MKRNLLKSTLQSTLRISGFVLLVLGLGIAPAGAQFWNGSVDNDWHTGGNWDGGVVPTFGNNAAIASNVNTNTIANISTANADSDGMFVGLEINGVIVDGTVNHSAFTGTFTNGMVIGRGGATGTYNQTGLTTDPNGPSIVNTGFINVGADDTNALSITSGTGFYNLSGDSQLNASGLVNLGELVGADLVGGTIVSSHGTMTLNDNAELNANFDDAGAGGVSINVGRQGTGGLGLSLSDEGTLNIHDNAVVNAADRIHVGDFFGAKGTVNQDGNSAVNSKTVWLGAFDAGGEGTEGTYNISGSAQLTTNNIIVGRDGGKGTFVASGSSIVDATSSTNNGAIDVGQFNGGNGEFRAEDSTTVSTGGITIGGNSGGTGVFTQSGASSIVSTTWMTLGGNDGGNGTYNMDGGTLIVSNEMGVGREGTGVGTFNQTDGHVDVGGWLKIGGHGHGDPEMPDPDAVGTYNISGGTLTVGNEIQVGGYGTGTLTQDGGDVTAGSWVSVAQESGSTGTYNLNAGTLTTGDNAPEDLNVGDNGNGTMTQAAGTTVTVSRDFAIGKNNGSVGTYTQNGGDITVGSWMTVGRNAGSTGTYNMNGGTIEVNGRFIMGAESTPADGPSQGTFNLASGTITVQQLVDGGGPVAGQEGVLVVGRMGAGTMNQSGGSISAQWVDVGGDPGEADPTNGGAYNMTGGTLTTTEVGGPGLRLGVSADPGSGSEFNISNNSTIDSAGTLEIGINSDASLRISGSNVTASFDGNMSMSSGTGVGTLGFGSDVNGVSAIQVGGDVDVTGGLLQAVFIPFVGLPTSAIGTPHDLLLVDNLGANSVTGELSLDELLDGSSLQLLSQGDQLNDPLGLLGGVDYYISYLGLTGSDNDIWLTLAPVLAAALPGDYNGNGIVDAADYAVWLDNLGSATPLLNDDGLGGPIGSAHYDLWKANFGNTLGTGTGGPGAVPEPASLALLGLGVLLFGSFYRRRLG